MAVRGSGSDSHVATGCLGGHRAGATLVSRLHGFVPRPGPNDERIEYFQNNSNLSYFVGVSANTKSPQSLLAGDRNLGGGTEADSDYGYSPANGGGNDIALPIADPVAWSMKMHSAGKPAGPAIF